MKLNSPKISILILNWNGLSDTLECLESVKKIDYPNFEVIVVDNGSTDGSATTISRLHPDIVIIETGKNLGFAEGNNVGIRHVLHKGSDFILLLNNDTVVDPQLLNAFIEASDLNPEGVFGAKIYKYSDPCRIWFAGARWDKEFSHFVHIGCEEIDNGDKYELYQEIDYVCGCAIFFGKGAVEKVGYLEPKFFLNFEETDWCFRARRSGFRCILAPKAKVWHKVSASFGGRSSPLYSYFMARNYLLWAERNLRIGERLRFYRTFLKELLPYFEFSKQRQYSFIKRFYWSIRKYMEDFRKNLTDVRYIAQIYGVRDYILRRFGDCPQQVRNLKG